MEVAGEGGDDGEPLGQQNLIVLITCSDRVEDTTCPPLNNLYRLCRVLRVGRKHAQDTIQVVQFFYAEVLQRLNLLQHLDHEFKKIQAHKRGALATLFLHQVAQKLRAHFAHDFVLAANCFVGAEAFPQVDGEFLVGLEVVTGADSHTEIGDCGEAVLVGEVAFLCDG